MIQKNAASFSLAMTTDVSISRKAMMIMNVCGLRQVMCNWAAWV
jgi:hypothetical protein